MMPIFTWILFAVLVGAIVYLFVNIPRYSAIGKEGFYGGAAVGSGTPDCSRTLNGSALLLDSLNLPTACKDSVTADYKELELILGKMGCLKKDLMSPSGIVEATRYQPFATSHDIQQIHEISAMCLNTTIAPRDLDIAFGKWRDRAILLIKRLSISIELKEGQVKKLEALFSNLWSDVYDVAQGRCIRKIETVDMKSGPAPRTPEQIVDLRPYNGYY